ncbi:Gfo/Idh/MocA family protein [Leifsonia poae]|uniref:Gfo/Idh/MocA family protein n=1 Tax=Leifsonia poae TaxID=110933 RepID=UPI001CBED6B8|nr:Gfo/Idh/MocA family oxidoreductase [Leifsonia poae]
MHHRIAVVGAGRMARAHAGAWARLGLEVAVVVSPRRRPELPEAPNARWATSLDDVLADPTLTVVSVCTPTPSHASIAIAALDAGKNVLLEKPIALTVPDALSVSAAAERSPGVLMVAQVVRFFAGYSDLADRVAADAIGTVRALRACRLSATPEWAPWLADEQQSGGMIVDFAIHDFDQANHFLGTPVAVRSVRGPGTGIGAGFGTPVETTIEYADGGVAQVLSVADLPADYPFRSTLELVGSRGTDAVHSDAGDAFLAQARSFLCCVDAGQDSRRSPTAAAVDALRVALAARDSLHSAARIELPALPAR